MALPLVGIHPGRWKHLVLPIAAAAVFAAGTAGQSSRLHRNQIEFARPDNTPLVLDASFPAAGPLVPAVIVVHGGGWEAGDRRTYVSPLLALLERSPYAWFSVDYRLAPGHPYPAAVEDVSAAVDWVIANATGFRVDASRIALVGESSGGHLVSLVGAKRSGQLAAVVPFYGIHNFESWFAPQGKVMRNAGQFLGTTAMDKAARLRFREASPITHVHPEMPPYLMIHGENDPGVPLSQSEEMCAAMKRVGARCEIFVLAGAGHGMENWERVPEHRRWKAPFLEWLAGIFDRR